jgi:hypothetical protein
VGIPPSKTRSGLYIPNPAPTKFSVIEFTSAQVLYNSGQYCKGFVSENIGRNGVPAPTGTNGRISPVGYSTFCTPFKNETLTVYLAAAVVQRLRVTGRRNVYFLARSNRGFVVFGFCCGQGVTGIWSAWWWVGASSMIILSVLCHILSV